MLGILETKNAGTSGRKWLNAALFPRSKKGRAGGGFSSFHLQPHGVAFVSVARQGANGAPRVTACDFVPAAGAGELRNVLQQMANRHGLGRARCTTVLAPNEYTLLLTEAPQVPREERRAAVRWRIKDLIDFPIEDATLDVFDVPAAAGQAHSVYVVAARSAAIQRVVDLCDELAIALDVIDIPEMAQRNLAGLLPEDAAGVVLLTFGADHGLITVTRKGELFMSRRLEIGANALARSPNPTAYFDQIVLEVQRSLDYFDSHFRQAPIGHVVVVPPPVALPGLIDFLNGNLNLRASEMDLAARLDCEPALLPVLQEHCLTALGAALREEDLSS
jgi:MSHA biogenesis protein MshI